MCALIFCHSGLRKSEKVFSEFLLKEQMHKSKELLSNETIRLTISCKEVKAHMGHAFHRAFAQSLPLVPSTFFILLFQASYMSTAKGLRENEKVLILLCTYMLPGIIHPLRFQLTSPLLLLNWQGSSLKHYWKRISHFVHVFLCKAWNRFVVDSNMREAGETLLGWYQC